MIQNITRNLHARICELKMLATDPAIVDAVERCDPAGGKAAIGRLRAQVEHLPFYLNAFAVTAEGDVIASADENARVVSHNLSGEPQFTRIITGARRSNWSTDEVWENPYSNNRHVLVFVAGLWPEDPEAAHPVGALYLEFDFETQIGRLISDGRLYGDPAMERTKVCIIDQEDRIVSSSWGAPFNRKVELAGQRTGLISRDHAICAVAEALEVDGFGGLGLRCMIEQHVASDEEILAAIGSAEISRAA